MGQHGCRRLIVRLFRSGYGPEGGARRGVHSAAPARQFEVRRLCFVSRRDFKRLKGVIQVWKLDRFYFESERGLFPNTEFVYDLELPADFVPRNADGEVETFELVPIEQVMTRVLSAEYKTTSCPTTLDFLIRHGFVNASNEPSLPELVELLHIPLHCLYGQSATRTFK